ncbi:MAG: sialidase family protein [Thermoplasmatota archaeon]
MVAILARLRLASVLVALSLLVLAAPPSGRAQASPPTFALSDAGVSGVELNIGVVGANHVFVGGWDFMGVSDDGAATWHKVAVNHVPGLGYAADRTLITDHDTGRVFVDDTTLACTLISWTDDEGATWSHNPFFCGGGVTDHEKIAVGKRVTFTDPTGLLYPNLVYVCANGLGATNCGASLDGGNGVVPLAPHGTGCAFQGAPITDTKGEIWEPSTACSLQVRTSADNGLTWALHATGLPSSSDTPDIAVTPDGTAYLAYSDANWHPAIARSTNGGSTWTSIPIPVAGLTSSVFPVIVAGADGRVAVAFYGTTDDAAGWNHNPGDAPDAIRWNGYEAIITDGEAASPTIAPVQLTTNADPLQYGCLSKLGSCLDNIADYADIDVSSDGHPYAVFMDGCPPGCTSHAQSTTNEAIVSVETSGPLLR